MILSCYQNISTSHEQWRQSQNFVIIKFVNCMIKGDRETSEKKHPSVPSPPLQFLSWNSLFLFLMCSIFSCAFPSYPSYFFFSFPIFIKK